MASSIFLPSQKSNTISLSERNWVDTITSLELGRKTGGKEGAPSHLVVIYQPDFVPILLFSASVGVVFIVSGPPTFNHLSMQDLN